MGHNGDRRDYGQLVLDGESLEERLRLRLKWYWVDDREIWAPGKQKRAENARQKAGIKQILEP